MPPLTTTLMQSRPLLDPSPHNIVPSLILSNPLYHKCRISDHLHLVLQWGLHTGRFSRSELAKMSNVYTTEAKVRHIRKHEGHPARAPDGTVMEIAGEACPGNTGEPVGPWEFNNVKGCAGYLEWRQILERGLKEMLEDGVSKEDINCPRPREEELERASRSEGVWLNGKPINSEVRKKLGSLRDGIRDKLQGFLTFVQKSVDSEGKRQMLHNILRGAFEVVMDGKKGRGYGGVLGGMIMTILERVEAFLHYLEDRVELEDVKRQRLEEIWEIFEMALQAKGKRKKEDRESHGDHPLKKAKVEASRDVRDDGKAEHNVPSKRSGIPHLSVPSLELATGPNKLSQKGPMKGFRERERRRGSTCSEITRSSTSAPKPASYPNKLNLSPGTEDNAISEEEEEYGSFKGFGVRGTRPFVPTVLQSIEVGEHTKRPRPARGTSEKSFNPALIQVTTEHEFATQSTQSEEPFPLIPFTDSAYSSFSSPQVKNEDGDIDLDEEIRAARAALDNHQRDKSLDEEMRNEREESERFFLREVKDEPDEEQNNIHLPIQPDATETIVSDVHEAEDGESILLRQASSKVKTIFEDGQDNSHPPNKSGADTDAAIDLDDDRDSLFLPQASAGVKAEPDGEQTNLNLSLKAGTEIIAVIDLDDDNESVFLPEVEMEMGDDRVGTIIDLDLTEDDDEDEDSDGDIQEISQDEWLRSFKKKR